MSSSSTAPVGQQELDPATPLPKKTERPHPLTPLIRGWVVLVAIVLTVGRQLIPDGSGNTGLPPVRWIILGVVGVCALAALAGLFTWWFTRFVIDDEELRIETGAIFRSSKRIAFERIQTVDLIQPLAARIFGLAELRIDVGSGDNQTKLRYLSRADATRLRDYLVARAHGEQADANKASSASLLTDSSATDRVIATVAPQRLVGAFLTSTEFLMSLLFLIGIYVVTGIFGVALYALPAVIPYAIGLFSLLGRHVLAQFNYTLAESGKGLRVTRGLTNLTSQSIPIDRVQGLRIIQPILWRTFGWFRIDVDVLGIKTSHGEKDSGGSTSILQPVASRDQVRAVLALVLPGVDLDRLTLHPSPRRSAWLRLFDFWTLRYGWDDDVVISQRGWLIRTREVVPHEKTQSVRIEQGPLQRRLRLTNVHIDTTPGPVDLVAKQIDALVARELATSQLDRAREAGRRAAERRSRMASARPDHLAGPAEPAILARFGIGRQDLLGAGNEARVFALPDQTHVLRIFPVRDFNDRAQAEEARLDGLLKGFEHRPVGLELPLIVERGHLDGQDFRIDRRIRGTDLSAVLRATPSTVSRRELLLTYLDAAYALRHLPVPTPQWARLIAEPRVFGSLADLLMDQIHRATMNWDLLSAQVGDLEQPLGELKAALDQRRCAPALVHADFCPPNVYGLKGRVIGVGDFSAHAVVADPLMDIAGAIAFIELESYPDAAADARWLAGKAAERLGDAEARWLDVYRRFYGFYYSMDPTLIDWCAAQIRSTGPAVG